MKIEPTTRFVLEPLLNCNIKCKMCYHLHKYDKWKLYTKSIEAMLQKVDDAKSRGNNYCDITGGEPTIYPDIIKLVKYCKFSGIKVCIITNGIVNEEKTDSLIKAGVDDFLVSRHGLEDTHNYITDSACSYKKQIRFLDQISPNMTFRFNCVISKFNQENLLKIAEEMIIYKPRVVNFINMNPHHEWMSNAVATKDVVADLRTAQSSLEDAIEFLEYNHVVVNLRYYPMCRLKESLRKSVCNDLHVVFDPYEWDYDISPKSVDTFREWGINTSNNVEEKGMPCCDCELQRVCGGINKGFHAAANELYGEVCNPLKNTRIEPDDFFYYRKEQGTK